MAAEQPLDEFFVLHSDNPHQLTDKTFEQIMKIGKIMSLSVCGSILISKDKTEYLIADIGAIIRNDIEKIVGVILIYRDITEQSKTEDELRQNQKMDSIGMFAGEVTHDFNNTLPTYNLQY